MEMRFMLQTWTFALKASNKSPATVYIYASAVQGLIDWMAEQNSQTELDHNSIRAYLAHLLETRSPATAHNRYRGLTTFFRWLVREGEIEVNPMDRVDPPMVPEKEVPILESSDVQRLLAHCAGKGFRDIRDTAIIRLFIDTGIRCSEMADLLISDVEFETLTLMVRNGKGRRPRQVPFTPKTALALSRYLARTGQPAGKLWIGLHGPMTRDGIFHMVQSRGRRAGLEGLHPHRFRHTFAHEWLMAGGNETDLMRLAGWRSRQMLTRYGASAGQARAIEAYRRVRS